MLEHFILFLHFLGMFFDKQDFFSLLQITFRWKFECIYWNIKTTLRGYTFFNKLMPGLPGMPLFNDKKYGIWPELLRLFFLMLCRVIAVAIFKTFNKVLHIIFCDKTPILCSFASTLRLGWELSIWPASYFCCFSKITISTLSMLSLLSPTFLLLHINDVFSTSNHVQIYVYDCTIHDSIQYTNRTLNNTKAYIGYHCF